MGLNFTDLVWPDGANNTPGIGYKIAVARLSEIDETQFPQVIEPDPSKTSGDFDFADLVTIENDIVFKLGSSGFKTIYNTIETGELKSELQGEFDGKSFMNTLEFLHPGSRPEMLGFAAYCKNGNLIFLIEEQDGQKRLLGHPRYPAKMVSAPGTTGKESAARKAVTFTFQSVSSYPAPVFLGNVILTGSGGTAEQEIFYLD
jgi:hypothetical protein